MAKDKVPNFDDRIIARRCPWLQRTSSVQSEGNKLFPKIVLGALWEVFVRNFLLLVRFIREIGAWRMRRVNLPNLSDRLWEQNEM